ncbi:hypothetical protein H4219_004772 [Mycoemilia scoparia]|uniref:AA9 family lytic polysaccharide monooxygenase n=1 Tax=Mycoemilia scoparia TaxID=417184 RepID=A0A9W7ZQJ0_9FUNG|nr:hypothetical protein H4219_004772 [Mycoemilia scoparia]
MLGHMGIVDPKPRLTGSDLKNPINISELPLCGVAARGPTQATVKAGSSMTMKFTDHGAAHGGGHCQFAISYNNKDFAVIQDELKHCFKDGPSTDNDVKKTSYDIKLPAELPSGEATIAWSWVNAIGNREYYMGCVDVKVEGSGKGDSFSGPQLLVVNHPTLGGGKTIPEFNGNYETGLDLFKARPKITVGPNAGSGEEGQGAYGKESIDKEKTDSSDSKSATAPDGANGGGGNKYFAAPGDAGEAKESEEKASSTPADSKSDVLAAAAATTTTTAPPGENSGGTVEGKGSGGEKTSSAASASVPAESKSEASVSIAIPGDGNDIVDDKSKGEIPTPTSSSASEPTGSYPPSLSSSSAAATTNTTSASLSSSSSSSVKY